MSVLEWRVNGWGVSVVGGGGGEGGPRSIEKSGGSRGNLKK